jgi:tetratricopeptide (TPR) repeat protein
LEFEQKEIEIEIKTLENQEVVKKIIEVRDTRPQIEVEKVLKKRVEDAKQIKIDLEAKRLAKIEENRQLIFDLSEKLSSLPLVDPTYQFFNSNYMITSGFEKQGFQILDELIMNDPRNLDYLNAKAGYYEQLNKIEEAIVIRLQIKRYDPWNARNLLSLGLDYKKIGNFTNMNSVLLQISNFAGDNEISIEAAEKLINE